MNKITSFTLIIFILALGALGLFMHRAYSRPYLNPLAHVSLPVFSPTPSSAISFSAWGPWWDQAAVSTSFASASAQLTAFSPSWYRLTPNLSLEAIPTNIKSGILNQASLSGVLIIPTIGNDLDGERASRFLRDQEAMSQATNYLSSQAQLENYAGFDVDFESLPPEDKDLYVAFLQKLHEKLKTQNLLLTVAVHAQTGSKDDWNLALSHDYAAIGAIADQVRIMAYDFHYAASEPGPVTPLDKLKSVTEYTLKSIPPEKIVFGLPLYGYDWGGGQGESVVYQTAMDRLNRYRGELKRDPASQEMVGTYVKEGLDHVIWFQDAQSIQAKIDLAKKLGISHFVFWRLGGEDPAIWPSL